MVSSGYSARDFGDAAERAFEECIKYWFGNTIECGKLIPDRQGIDLRTQIRPVRNTGDALNVNWQIKARHILPNESRLYPGERVYRIDLSESEQRTLIDATSSADPTYLVLGIPAISGTEWDAQPSIDKFSWYAIDLKQYRTRILKRYPNASFQSVSIPLRNRLNLATVSLLWGSIWTSRISHSLNNDIPRLNHSLWSLLRQIAQPGALNREELDSLMREVTSVLSDIDPGSRAYLNLTLGNLTSVATLDVAAAEIGAPDSYLSYTSESLGDEINLWLFLNPIRSFTRRWQKFTTAHKFKRLFPVSPIASLPRSFRCTLFHILQWHKAASVSCEITKINLNAGKDIYAHIGRLGTLTLDCIERMDQYSIGISENVQYGKRLRNMLMEVSRTVLVRSETSANEMLAALQLDEIDKRHLFLHGPGFDLMAPESWILTYPRLLWRLPESE
jgi:hypothetical protein